jgi:DNA-binding response OmpR family regulator
MKILDDVKTILGKPQPHQEINNENAPPKTVLIFKDEPIPLSMYRDKFKLDAFNVITAEDGKKGLELALSTNPNSILLDLALPKIKGIDIMETLRTTSKGKTIPIIVLTNIYADAEDLVKNWGVEYFLLKANYKPETIVARVKETLETKST